MNPNVLTDTVKETVRNWNGRLLGPSPENRKLEGIQVFKNEWFERHFATAHPIMPGVWWLPVVAYMVYATVDDARFRPTLAITGFVLGVLAWTLIEYLLHRYVFHIVPEPDFDSKLKQFMVHGYHHEFPNDRMRLVAPLLLSLPIGIVVAAAYFALLGPYHWQIWYAGTTVGYLAYDWMHYYTHHFRPTTRLGRFLRRYHMEHHYKDSDSHFGISSPLWDYVFGTAKAKRSSESEETAALS